ncbi:peptidoglycan binding domain-containing protein [Facklamia sp. DSM 111018]|uniref:Peptidoglycan binding domain-containing protein n=1 Tax=Facklamia lactis TaxID=2749967 RepID=A0ABS0LRI2_9LACT|nr:L,D-transpeptidase family protein [Facklamia lactis]MBG9980864.1 peptidoglycan binding domain-containing protein [Facklamia lactis]MBG9986773.1 peptidoglycan binding domain-containing protein [Facklamia lactis]
MVEKHDYTVRKKYKSQFLIGSLFFIIVFYFIGVLVYQDILMPRTYIGPVLASQMNGEVADLRVQEYLKQQKLTLFEQDEEIMEVEMSKLNPKVLNIKANVQEAIMRQNSLAWPLYYFKKTNVMDDFEEKIECDLLALEQVVNHLGIDMEKRDSSQDAQIVKEGESFKIKPEIYGKQVNAKSLARGISKSLADKTSTLDLENAYIQPKLTEKSPKLQEQMTKIDKMLETKLTLAFADNSLEIPTEKIVSWINIDENSELTISLDQIEKYIDEEINPQYAGRYQTHEFQSTYQGQVTVQPGTFGWYIDSHQEAKNILEDIKNGVEIIREPTIIGAGYEEEDEFGSHYVEVDLTNQMMLIYHDHQLVLETPIVSGQTGTDTIPGAYQVWNKESPSVLVGYNPRYDREYQQPVSYWIAFDDQAQGIHDANWQGSFGGEAYRYSGSLGCINTPPSIMGQVYELIDYGMPVVIF